MPTKKKRITLTLEDHEYEILKRYSDVMGESMASIVCEMLESVTPGLKIMVEAQERLQNISEERREQLTAMLQNLHDQMEVQVQGLIDFVEERDEKQPPYTNRGVENSNPAK
jgi:23S rRNA maturation-related 3'-5' exoribonuclease YhaM